jgi:hypothetical protein
MAKARKTRRAKQRRARALRQARPAAQVAPTTAATSQPKPASFAEEYQYVIADLKRIFILAAGMLALLVVLALVLR